MTPDDEGVVGAIAGYKIGKSATPILVPILLFALAAALWNFWLGPVVLKTIAQTFPLLVLLAALSGLWSAGTIIHRFRQTSQAVAEGTPPTQRPWYSGLVAVPLKISIGITLALAVLIQIGIENPWPPKPQPAASVSAKPASPSATH
jgi:hypothetical protein